VINPVSIEINKILSKPQLLTLKRKGKNEERQSSFRFYQVNTNRKT